MQLHSRATSALTLIQSELLLVELPAQAVRDASCILHHVHTIVLPHIVHPRRLQSAELSQPELIRQLHICSVFQYPSGVQKRMVHQERNTSDIKRSLFPTKPIPFSCRSRQIKCQWKPKQCHTLATSAATRMCSAVRVFVALNVNPCRRHSLRVALFRP